MLMRHKRRQGKKKSNILHLEKVKFRVMFSPQRLCHFLPADPLYYFLL